MDVKIRGSRSHSSSSASSSSRSRSRSPIQKVKQAVPKSYRHCNRSVTPDDKSRSKQPSPNKSYRRRSASKEKLHQRSPSQDKKASHSPRRDKKTSTSPSRRSHSRDRKISPGHDTKFGKEKRHSTSREPGHGSSREKKYSPSREKRHSPVRERRRSPGRRHSPGWEKKRSHEKRHAPSYDRKKSPFHERGFGVDKKRSPSHDRKHSPKHSRHFSPGRERTRKRYSRSQSREKKHKERSSPSRHYRKRSPSPRRGNDNKKSKDALTKSAEGNDLEKPSFLPLNVVPQGQAVTPQLLLQQTMAAVSAQAAGITGVPLPKYYNPTAVNPLKYAEQMQKRKLLWHGTKEKPEPPKSTNLWEKTKFMEDQDGKMTAKFRKLMGIKGESGEEEIAEAPSNSNTDATLMKQEALFRDLDQQYEVARISTHTQRGVGLGYSAHPTLIFPK